MPDDIFTRLGVSPNEYEYDPASDTVRRKPDTFDERWALPIRPQMDTMNDVPNVPTNVALPSPQAYIPEQPNLNYALPIATSYTGDIPQTVVPQSWIDKPFSAGTERINEIFGVSDKERYQTFPERMVRSGATLASDLVTGKLPIDLTDEVKMEPNWLGEKLGMTNSWSGPSPHGLIGRAQDLSGMAGMSTLPGVAMAGGIAKDALGVVPVARARELNVTPSVPSDILKSAVENTPGAVIDPDGALRINIKRGQKPEQEMAESVRGGVFYLPKGDRNFRHYKGKIDDNTGRPNNNYGGSQLIEGETAYLNPIVVKGATGGTAPEAAYIQLMGADAFKQLRKDVTDILNSSTYIRYNPTQQIEMTQRFLEKYAPDLVNHAEYIIENSKQGNQLRYALQEAAIGTAVRNAGHDGVIGYSVGRGQNSGKPFISEILDVRENRYPSPSGDYSVHPQFENGKKLIPVEGNPFLMEDSKAATAIAALNQSGFYSNLERTVANSKVQKGTPEQWLGPREEIPFTYKDQKTGEMKEGKQIKYSGALGNAGLKPDEIESLGLSDWLASKNKPGQNRPPIVTKEEILDFIKENGTKIDEVWKGDKPKYKNENNDFWEPDTQGNVYNREGNNVTKYSSYQLPGGENYRELLLTLPSKKIDPIQHAKQFYDNWVKRGGDTEWEHLPQVEKDKWIKAADEQANDIGKHQGNYKSSHWDEPNPVAHIRMNDRVIGPTKDIDLKAHVNNGGYWQITDKDGNFIGSMSPDVGAKSADEAIKIWKDQSGSPIQQQGGFKSLHVEEIQSDWHQAGRKQGYRDDTLSVKIKDIENQMLQLQKEQENLLKSRMTDEGNGVWSVKMDTGEIIKFNNKHSAETVALMPTGNVRPKWIELDDKMVKLNREKEELRQQSDNTVPNAPFKKTWDELALKRILTEAVRNDYDAVSWTPGEAQAARYDLSKHLKSIDVVKEGDFKVWWPKTRSGADFESLTTNKEGIITKAGSSFGNVEGKHISDVFGKEIAEKGLENFNTNERRLEDVDLKVGGEGMKAFYDKMLVDKANALVKKMGGKVEYEYIKGAYEPTRENLRRSGREASLEHQENGNIHVIDENGNILGRFKESEYNAASQMAHEHRVPKMKIPIIKLTPQMKEKIAKEGFPLFSSGVPIFTPVDNDPWKKPKLVPVDFNPFENAP